MNRKERRALQKQQHTFAEKLPDKLTLVPREEFPVLPALPLQAWRSRKYLVELWAVDNPQYPYMVRLSICRVKLGSNGRWHDGLTWDELQAIKAEVGYGNWYGVEIYPPDARVVNVANFRHLWLMPTPLSIGF